MISRIITIFAVILLLLSAFSESSSRSLVHSKSKKRRRRRKKRNQKGRRWWYNWWRKGKKSGSKSRSSSSSSSSSDSDEANPTSAPITASPTTASPTTSPTQSPTDEPTTASPTTASPTTSPTPSPTDDPTTAAPTSSPKPKCDEATINGQPIPFVEYNGKFYATIDGTNSTEPNNGPIWTPICPDDPYGWYPLPSGWSVASVHPDTTAVANSYPWGAQTLVFNGGSASTFGGTLMYCRGGPVKCDLEQGGDKYKASSCDSVPMRVLITCDPGARRRMIAGHENEDVDGGDTRKRMVVQNGGPDQAEEAKI